MFDKKAAIILGAGASVPFGYPIGSELISNIVRGLDRLPAETIEERVYAGRTSKLDFVRQPYLSLVTYALANRPDYLPRGYSDSLSEWKSLATELDQTSHQSIDEFARTNPNKNRVVKLLIAAEIASHSFDKTAFASGKLQPAEGLFSNARSNWYGKLVAQLRKHHRSSQAFRDNDPVPIITFNYDRSLETFLERELPRAEIYSDLNWRDAASVIHVHGSLQIEVARHTNPTAQNAFAQSLIKSAENFLVIDDPRSHQDPAAIARTVISQAETVVVLGFDFHPANVKLIGLDNPSVVAKLRILNYTGGRYFDQRVARLGIASDQIFKRSGTLEISAAIEDGIFD